MSAKDDFRKAWRLIRRARRLTTPHLDQYLYPIVFEDFAYLSDTLYQLATEGALQPETETGQNAAASRSK